MKQPTIDQPTGRSSCYPNPERMKKKKPSRRDIMILVVTLIVFTLIFSFWDEIKEFIAGILT